MKLLKLKSLLLIAIMGLISACNSLMTKDDITLIQEEIESVIMQSINDPSSYTFVEIQVLDTTYYSQILQELISSNENQIKEATDRLNHDIEFLANLEERAGSQIDRPDIQNILRPYKESISRYEARIDELNNQIYLANEISQTLDHNRFFLSLTYAYRANNEFGALQLINEKYEVEKFEEDIQILWSGEKKLIDECRSLNYEIGGTLWELCISLFENNARSQFLSKIKDSQ